ncbi:MAG TPA: GerMN domain-containing protein [Candidatus Acidoferrum sp.]|nr:GerMN domain-containing protein [Candidatus Acidoferrum sp.]
MTAKWRTWLLAGLALAVIVGAIYLPILRRRLQLAAKLQQQTAEQARRELTQTIPISPGEPRVKTKLFWASGNGDGTLTNATVELPLSSDPVLRSKQVLNTLLAGPVDTELRTLPPDAVLLAFYLLPNGTAIADFSEALATETPSGIQSEQMAVDSIARTLEANVPKVQRLKILIHGQEVETLAGHLDLTGTFLVNTSGLQVAPAGATPTTPPSSDKPAETPAPATKPGSPTGAGTLTPDNGSDKLAQPERKAKVI